MTKEEFIEKIKSIPNLYIGKSYDVDFASIGLITFNLSEDGVEVPFFNDDNWLDNSSFYDEISGADIRLLMDLAVNDNGILYVPYESISEDMIPIFETGFKSCLQVEKRGDPNVDQLVFIYPDCDDYTIGEILNNVKYIVGEVGSSEGVLAVINQGDWNFSNKELIKVLYNNTNASIIIKPKEKDDFFSDDEFVELYDEMKEKHPEIENMPFFTIDYD